MYIQLEGQGSGGGVDAPVIVNPVESETVDDVGRHSTGTPRNGRGRAALQFANDRCQGLEKNI